MSIYWDSCLLIFFSSCLDSTVLCPVFLSQAYIQSWTCQRVRIFLCCSRSFDLLVEVPLYEKERRSLIHFRKRTIKELTDARLFGHEAYSGSYLHSLKEDCQSLLVLLLLCHINFVERIKDHIPIYIYGVCHCQLVSLSIFHLEKVNSLSPCHQ